MDRYTIGTNNRYALFLGEEDTADPQDIRKLVEVEKAKKTLKTVVPVVKENKISNKDVKEAEIIVKSQPEGKAPMTHEEAMEKVKNRRNREDRPVFDSKPKNGEATGRQRRDDPSRRPRDFDASRREGDARVPRRERRDFNDGDVEGRPDRRAVAPAGKVRPRQLTPSNRRKRDFDRKSGSDKTGVKHVDKREGAGAHNWGTHKDDLAQINPSPSEVLSGDEVESPEGKIDNGPETTAAEKEAVEEVAEVVKELTLDEYRALRGKRQQPQFNLRRAGEGEDLTQWNNLVEIKKKNNEDVEDDEIENIEFPQRMTRQKQVLGIDITFKDTRRGGRPARNGPRPNPREYKPDAKPFGRKNFGGPRDFRADEGVYRAREPPAPRVDDEKAFPSLG